MYVNIYCIGSNCHIRYFKGYKSVVFVVGLSLIYEILINTVMQRGMQTQKINHEEREAEIFHAMEITIRH